MITSALHHYENHLAHFYAWMTGDFNIQQEQQQQYFEKHGVKSSSESYAIDLGAGHGIQSISLAKLGFQVTAIDFNHLLLHELSQRAGRLSIRSINDDIKNISAYAHLQPACIVCAGDTLTHLNSESEIRVLLQNCKDALTVNGFLYLSFRDYTTHTAGTENRIDVKSDDTRKLTCVLSYQETHVTVTDILHEKQGNHWIEKVSSYQKVRISPAAIVNFLEENGVSLVSDETSRGMHHLLFRKN